MQPPDHADGQPALAIENFGDAGSRADNLFEVPAREPLLLHTEFDRFDGIRGIHRIVLRLIGIYEGRKHIESVAVARSSLCAP